MWVPRNTFQEIDVRARADDLIFSDCPTQQYQSLGPIFAVYDELRDLSVNEEENGSRTIGS